LKKLIVIAGPTASGKTSLAIQLALNYKSEIISADSRQFYKKMDIGTAKPSKAELKKVPHHFIDFLDVNENFNAGKFETEAIQKIDALFLSHDILFLTGGSGLYIDAVCKGVDELPESVPELRNELNRQLEEEGIESLQLKLKSADPEYFSSIDINNPHRLIRALEVIKISGQKFSSLRKNTIRQRNFAIKKIGLLIDRDELYDRINQRVDDMITQGLVKEAEALLPYRNENSMQTVGYREIIDYLDRKITLEKAIDLIKQNTRNYAKRQMTWFRRDTEIKWFDPEEIDKMKRFIEE
jgi:tRNA dimethylallyltransferase